MSNAFFERFVSETLSGRVNGWGIDFVLLYRGSIRMVRCEAGARMSREMHGAEYLYEARARGTRVLFA